MLSNATILYWRQEMKYPNLFSPIKIGTALFKNRMISAPTGHPDVTPHNYFTEDAITYYERKAQGGVAAIILGEAIVDSKYGKRHTHQVSLDTPDVLYNLSRLADSVTRHGTVLSIELQHSGMNATPGIITPNFCTASDIVYGPVDGENRGVKIREMPEEIIYEIIDKFAKAAKTRPGMRLWHGNRSRRAWLAAESVFYSESEHAFR